MFATQNVPAAVASPVRMILYDYDSAPDGAGTYVKLNQEFPSRRAALDYKERILHGMYWGKLETLAGELIKQLDERYDS